MAIPILRSKIFLSILAAIGMALAFAASYVLYEFRSDSLTSEIAERVAALHVKPSEIEFTYKKALRAGEAIRAGDFATADQIAADVLADSQIQNWRYYPFDDFVTKVFYGSEFQFAPRLSDWVAKNPTDAIPLLLRAQYYYDTGWAKRGHNFSNKTEPQRMTLFSDYMVKALADVNAAIDFDNRNPYNFYLKLRILQGNGVSQAFASAFDEAVEKYPAYYPLYEIALSTLQPRWGGKVPAMYGFVDKYAGSASESSPLKLLYLSLYQHLLSTASVDCAAYGGDREKTAQCVVSFMQKLVMPGLEQHVSAALQLYDHTDKYQFGLAVKKIVSDMLSTPGGDTYSGAILQIAATSMHSDTQLKEDKPDSRKDYVIDELVAESWHDKGFHENEMTKYKEALTDAQSAAFPSEEEKNLVIASIYDKLSTAAERQNQYVDEIAFEKAAVTLGVTSHEYYICHGYYKLKRYTEAEQACTDAIKGTGHPNAWYWRGAAYRDSGKLDDALQDFTTVADSEGYFASWAAIDMSMIYFNRHDDQGALNVLNKYTFLYDPNRKDKSGVAVAYNNRCYAYMQLGELKKALDDCTQSLKYGSIPDAFRKQQELVKRLGTPEKGF